MVKKKKKREKKVRCATCEAQYNGFCTTKRVTVSMNKSRHCDKYTLDGRKVQKESKVIVSTRLPYSEQEAQRQMRKAELKELKKRIKTREDILTGTETESRIYKPDGDETYPLTGNLDRFKTTGTDKEE